MEDTGTFLCPYCGQRNDVAIDPGGGADQRWVTDCEVCCRPIVVRVHMEENESTLMAEREADAE